MLLARQRGDDKARVGFARPRRSSREPFRLCDDPALVAPAIARAPAKSLKRRAGLPLCWLSSAAAASSASISPTSRVSRAKPNRKSMPLVSHQVISPSRAKPNLGAAECALPASGCGSGDDPRHLLDAAALPSMLPSAICSPAGAGRRTRRAADSNNCRSSRGRNALPGARAAVVSSVEVEGDLRCGTA